MTFEFRCMKCNKETDHYLKITHPCECGGKLKYIYTPVKLLPTGNINHRIPLSKKFIPVKYFGGFGDIWYYRRKPRKRLIK